MAIDPVRSKIMRAVRREDTEPELRVRRIAHALGLRFRLHRRDLPGTPDLVFPKLRTIVFVHGCFWHRDLGCTRTSTPKTRAKHWVEKFRSNIVRDDRVAAELRALGWHVVVIWECETKTTAAIKRRLQRLIGK